MLLKNLTLYRISDRWPARPDTLEKKLADQPLKPCGGFQMESIGWTPPRDEGEFLYHQNHHWMPPKCSYSFFQASDIFLLIY